MSAEELVMWLTHEMAQQETRHALQVKGLVNSYANALAMMSSKLDGAFAEGQVSQLLPDSDVL